MKNTFKATSMIAVIYLFTGYQELSAQAKKDSLKEKQIDEVVMIGYGTAKKSDITSSISTVKAAELIKTPASQLTQGLQGKVAGLRISSFGAPGEAPSVSLRGKSSLQGSSAPLFVVDGIFMDDIDFLNPDDILDVTTFKDASASAIYGRKAANGVIVVTTKSGNFDRKPKIIYNTYYGIQQAANVTKMANSEQYTIFTLESGANSVNIAKAIERYGRSRLNPLVPNVNTDWYKETLRLAPISNHSLSIDGGSKDVSYSLGGNYYSQDGILRMDNSYQRFVMKAKIDAKVKDWLNTGINLIFSRSEQYRSDNGVWQQIYNAVPIMPVYDPAYTDASPLPYADAKDLDYRDHQNPFQILDNVNLLNQRRRLTATGYGEVYFIPRELSFKTTFSYNTRIDNSRNVYLPFFVTNSFQRKTIESSISRETDVIEDYQIDNVVTYNKKINNHDITLLGGVSYADNYGRVFGTGGNFLDNGTFSRYIEQSWYIANTDLESRSGFDYGLRQYALSYFGRFAYKYKNKYIFYATDRTEGTNKYKDTYINLPAFGLAWIVSNEAFLKDNNIVNFLKLKAGWGRLVNGTLGINRLSKLTSIQTVFDNQLISGAATSTYNDNLGYEYTEESNFGISLELFNKKLTIDADYYIKNTNDLGINVKPIIGNEASESKINIGGVRNKGVEISATWKSRIGDDFTYSISGNFSKNDNKIIDIAHQSFIDSGLAEARQKIVVGQPIDVFYGFVMDGIYQNQAEVNADAVAISQNSIKAESVKPGYIKYKDLNGDGKLDANDLTYIGSPVPTYFYGATINLGYKNWDLSASIYGQGGNAVLNRNRLQIIWTNGNNVDAELAKYRWHGEGTSNDLPSAEGYLQPWNQKFSSFFLEKGDFFRLQNVQLGYTLKTKNLPEMRFSITADRPYLWTKSKVIFSPEVPDNGVDLNIYPTPSVFTFGYSVKF